MKRRKVDAEHPAYDPGFARPDGRGECRRCLGPLTRPGSMFCSAACVHEFRIRSSPAYARIAVYRRDRGVCTHCRLDCGMLDRVVARLRRGWAGDGDGVVDAGAEVDGSVMEGAAMALAVIAQVGQGVRKRPCSLWQVDHRVAFSMGGADCGLGNLRTLCLVCHREQTAALAASAAAAAAVPGGAG